MRAIDLPKLPKLIKTKPGGTRIYKRTLDKSVQNLAERLKGSTAQGRLSLYIADDDIAYSIDLDGTNARISEKHGRNTQLHIVTSKRTWVEITSGRLSPAMAYLTGKMSVSGEAGFIKRAYAIAAEHSDSDPEF